MMSPISDRATRGGYMNFTVNLWAVLVAIIAGGVLGAWPPD
jgi:hypothetical protein